MTNPEPTDPRTDHERALDNDAFERAITWFRGRSKARSRQIDDMLATREFERVGRFAAWAVQMNSLGLDPWTIAPCRATLRDLDKPHDESGERQAAELRKRLIDAGLSPWEPFPLVALGRIGVLPKDQKLNYAEPVEPFRR